jgi:hypothetical protein
MRAATTSGPPLVSLKNRKKRGLKKKDDSTHFVNSFLV